MHDVSGKGTDKTYGRVFYTKGRRLIFYAFDLDAQPSVQNARSFQAGRKGPDKQQARSVGIFCENSVSKKRWILKADDPKALEDIDAVFVAVEPNGGSHTQAGSRCCSPLSALVRTIRSLLSRRASLRSLSFTGTSALDAHATATQPEESDAGIQDALVMLRLNGFSTYSAKLPGHSINSSNGGKVCVGCSLTRSTMLCVLESIRRRILLSSAENERVSEPR